MKKTLKRALIVIALVVTAVLVFSFSSSAVENCGVGNHLTGTRVVEPTCTEGGWTETYCTVCKEVFGKDTFTTALGHDFVNANWTYAVSGDGYIYQAKCARENCNTVTNDGKFYYAVTLANPWTTETTTTKDELSYATLAKTYKTATITDVNGNECVLYVEQGDTIADYVVANYEGIESYSYGNNTATSWLWNMINRNLIFRQKDKDYGKYTFTGWTTYENNAEADSFFDVEATAIEENTTLYSSFKGELVYYTVSYVNQNGKKLTIPFEVAHGAKADDSIFLPDTNGVYGNPPSLEESTGFYYVFTGWDRDINAIYGNCEIVAEFDTVRKTYRYVFCDYQGNPIYLSDGTPITEDITYGKAATVTQIIPSSATAKPADSVYIYSWSGEWLIKDTNLCVNNGGVNAFTVPNYVEYKDIRHVDCDTIYLVPGYVTKKAIYDVVITIKIPEDNYYLGEVNIQITDANGQIVGYGATDVNGEFTCTVNYSDQFYVTAVTPDEKYVGEGTFRYRSSDGKYYCTVNMAISESYNNDNSYKCTCIHHNTLFRSIWVRILNLLYRLFNVKYVCCYDMYATIGSLLSYTP